MTLAEVTEKMQERFVKVDEVTEALFVSQKTCQNIILYGLGGYGKSEISEHFLNVQGEKPFIQVFGTGMTEERLLGGLKMKEFQADGNIAFNTLDSFMNHEYVIFEEVFDAPMRILLILKDIITSGYLRNGSQQFKIKTKLIICCTNRSKAEVIEDNSHKALLERFPLVFNVAWDSHNQEDFEELFLKVTGDPVPQLAKLVAALHSQGIHISPRTAVKMSKVYAQFGENGLKYVDGVPHELLELIKEKHEEEVVEQKQKEAFNIFKQELKNVSIINDMKNPDDYETLLQNSILCGYVWNQLKNTTAIDEVSNKELEEMIDYFEAQTEFWSTQAFENAQPTKKVVKPIQKVFENYEKNVASGI